MFRKGFSFPFVSLRELFGKGTWLENTIRDAGIFKPIHCEAFAGNVAGSGWGTVICRKTMISSSVSGVVKRPIS